MPPKILSARIEDHFQSLPDPRRLRVMYPLINVVTIAPSAASVGPTTLWPSPSSAGRKRSGSRSSSISAPAFHRTIGSMHFLWPSRRLSSRSAC